MDPISVEKLLEIVRLKGGTLPQRLAAHLFCAAVWRAARAGAALRPGLIILDPLEGLRLELANRGEGLDRESGYVAPEALAGDAAANDPQVLVYAAGALGYELLVGEPPPTPLRVSPALSGPLGEIVRVALAPHPSGRFHGLDQMSEALQEIHPATAPELEKVLFTSLYGLCSRWVPERAPPLIPAEDAGGAQGRGAPETAAMVKWMWSMDAAVEQIQRQQLELIAALASPEHKAGRAAEQASADGRKAREQENLELLHRISALSRMQARAPEPARRHPSLWLTWGGAILAGVLGAFAVFVALGNRVETGEMRAVEDARTQATAPQPPPESTTAPAGPRPQAMVTTPMILSVPKEPASADAGQTSGTEAQPAGAPPPPVPSAAGKLVESGERALRRGRPADALVAFESALASQPALPRAVRGAAMAQMMLGKEREAREGFERYLRLAPTAEDVPRIEKVIEGLHPEASR